MNHAFNHEEVNEAIPAAAKSHHDSADVVKGLLYNIPECSKAVNQKGRKPGPSKRNAAPFAQSENLVDVDYPPSYHVPKQDKQVNDKVGHGQFDPEVYKANAMANINNRAQSRTRNFVGAGNILSYDR